jgi:DNA repair exonuclease SbcCD nuclease subunit
MSVLVLHVSDTHLGYRQYGLVEREQDLYEVFSEVVELALRERVDIVVHSGDLFDSSRPPMQAVRAAIDGIRRLADAGIPFVTILGDHDLPRRREMPPSYLLEHLLGNVTVLGKPGDTSTMSRRVRTRSGKIVYVAGVFAHRGSRVKILPETLLRVPKPPEDLPSIMLVHQGLEGVAPEAELKLSDLPKGFSYYAFGHVHVFRELRYGEARVVYPGSIDYMRVDEVKSDRVVVLAHLSPRVTAAVEQVKLRTVRPQLLFELAHADVESKLAELTKLISSVKARKKPLLHVVVKGPTNTATRKAVREHLERLRHLLLDYRLVFKPSPAVEAVASDAYEVKSLDLRSLLAERLKDEDLAELAYQLVLSLGYLGPSEGLREALRATEEWFRKRYGVEP